MGLASTMLVDGGDSNLIETSHYVWHDRASWFGGLSGAEVSADGQFLVIITDRGRVMEAEIIREDGVVVGLNIIHSVALRDADGKLLAKPDTDAEGLAIGADGQAFVSFESPHRVAMLDKSNGTTQPLISAPEFSALIENRGLETLAISPDGTLMTLPEATRTDFFPIYAYVDDGWQVTAQIPKRGPFVPVGADFDANGLLYLLERTVTPLGFRSRIRRFDLTAPELGEKTLLQTLPAQYDNLEAISVWQNNAGETCLTLISDDNFLPIQETQVLEFVVSQ